MSTDGGRRVVITGLGAVTPLGNDVRSSWENLVAGRSAAGPITAFDTTRYMVTFACEAKGFEPTRWIEQRQARRMDRFAQMVVAAARQAQADAGLEIEQECDRIGASIAIIDYGRAVAHHPPTLRRVRRAKAAASAEAPWLTRQSVRAKSRTPER